PRRLQLTAVPGMSLPAGYGFYYDGTGSGNPRVTIQVNAGSAPNVRYDLSVLTDTVGKPGSGINLAALYAAGGPARVRNLVVAGDLQPGAANPGFFGLPAGTPGGVQLPQDDLAGVAAQGNVPAASILLKSIQSLAFGSAAGVSADNAAAGDALGLLALGTALAQANDTFLGF